MFDLEFTSEETEGTPALPERIPSGFVMMSEQQSDTHFLRGRTTLGTFQEDFLASLHYWDRADYERHWIEAARRLVDGEDRVPFLTSAFQLRWTMYREGDDVFVQEQMLVPEYEPDPFRIALARETLPEDGHPISEWRLVVADFHQFVDRRGPAYSG